MKIIVECLVCKKKVEVYPSRAKKFKTCSYECLGKLNAGKINSKCEYCGKEFHLKEYRRKRASNNFCSVACHASWKSENQRGSNNPNFRNREYDADGYRVIHSTYLGSIKEHHAVVFEALKIDKIPDGYQVHHRDCNKLNNVPENLVLITNSDHRWLHKQFGNATLYAHYYGKVTTKTLCEWSNEPEQAKRLLDLNILQQSAVVKSSELLGSPEEDNQQPS